MSRQIPLDFGAMQEKVSSEWRQKMSKFDFIITLSFSLFTILPSPFFPRQNVLKTILLVTTLMSRERARKERDQKVVCAHARPSWKCHRHMAIDILDTHRLVTSGWLRLKHSKTNRPSFVPRTYVQQICVTLFKKEKEDRDLNFWTDPSSWQSTARRHCDDRKVYQVHKNFFPPAHAHVVTPSTSDPQIEGTGTKFETSGHNSNRKGGNCTILWHSVLSFFPHLVCFNRSRLWLPFLWTTFIGFPWLTDLAVGLDLRFSLNVIVCKCKRLFSFVFYLGPECTFTACRSFLHLNGDPKNPPPQPWAIQRNCHTIFDLFKPFPKNADRPKRS